MKRLSIRLARKASIVARNERGSIAIEMACVLFFLSVLILGTFELPRMLLLAQKLERASASIADLVAQIDPATDDVAGNIDDLMSAAQGLMSPYTLSDTGRIIISSIANPTGDQEKVMWQVMSDGGIPAISKVGQEGDQPDMPGGMVVRAGENIIVAEIVYHYEPLFGSIIYDEKTLYSSAYTRPRFSNLTTKPY